MRARELLLPLPMTRSYALLLGSLLVTWSAPLLAGYGCPGYFGHLPSVQRLKVDEEGRVVPAALGQELDAWISRPTPCTVPVALPVTSLAELFRYRPKLREWIGDSTQQEIRSEPVECVEVGGATYFGLSFYQGEGQVGLGGIGAQGHRARRAEIRRRSPLAGLSVSRMLHDGTAFWIALANDGEGFSNPGGLFRYEWGTKRLEPAITEDDGPCGFWINDMLITGGSLYVATDLGVSVRDLANGSWRHTVPAQPGGQLVPTACTTLYERLLATLPREMDARDGACPLESAPRSPYAPRGIFRAYLQSFRPRTLRALEER